MNVAVAVLAYALGFGIGAAFGWGMGHTQGRRDQQRIEEGVRVARSRLPHDEGEEPE